MKGTLLFRPAPSSLAHILLFYSARPEEQGHASTAKRTHGHHAGNRPDDHRDICGPHYPALSKIAHVVPGPFANRDLISDVTRRCTRGETVPGGILTIICDIRGGAASGGGWVSVTTVTEAVHYNPDSGASPSPQRDSQPIYH